MNVDLARIQFASTSIYHFLFVPVTIGLGFLVAILQTMWYRGGDPEYKRLTKFFGTLLVINVAIGVVTGLVQEFEFGMNWSSYSRYVGDVFGAPLAMEGLAAFFLESTFLGLWLFGWDRLPKRIHLATIWLVAFGGVLSAAFIMAANSWMQHPVGYEIDPTTNRPVLNNIGAVFTNPVFVWGYAARRARITRHRITRDARRVRVAPPSPWRREPVLPHCEDRPRGAGPGDPAEPHRRQQARHHRDDVPTDEDRRRGSAMGDLRAVLVLGVPDRRRQVRRDPEEDHRDPASAVRARDGHVGRPGAGPQPPERAVPAAVRSGPVHPERLHPVLVDARDGLPGRAHLPARPVGRVAPPSRQARDVEVVPARRRHGRSSPRS